MTQQQCLPNGELVLRTLTMPTDTNANGDIFGGWLMSQMDIGGAILAKEIALGRVVTVRVDGITFLRSVAVGDVVLSLIHISEPTRQAEISYAVFCLKKKKQTQKQKKKKTQNRRVA